MPSEPKQLPLPPPPLPCTHRDLSGTARGEATRTRARPDPSSPPVADAAAAARRRRRRRRPTGKRRSDPTAAADRCRIGAGGARIWYGSRGGSVIPWSCEAALAFCPVWVCGCVGVGVCACALARGADRGVAFGSDLADVARAFLW